jgi:hypothetical protein
MLRTVCFAYGFTLLAGCEETMKEAMANDVD